MSHFTEIKTKMTQIELIKKTLEALKLSFEYDEKSVAVRGFYGAEIEANFKIDTGTKFDLGLRKIADGSFEFVADWEMLKASKIQTEEIQNKILQKYSYLEVKKNLEDQGYAIAEEETDSEGNIQILVSKW